ncbi:MAG: four helix bundle protein [Planctomycetes bacterium]|nr:four helix bundle protein [Planctomycetota bacterium]
MSSIENDLSDRTYKFALSVIELVRKLPREMAAQEIGRQLLRSATSIAANYEEATVAFSKEDFTYKLSISFKEAKETNLWLRLLKDSELNKSEDIDKLIQESLEIKKIFGKSVKTSKQNLKKNAK